jgi:hypothetical protein
MGRVVALDWIRDFSGEERENRKAGRREDFV